MSRRGQEPPFAVIGKLGKQPLEAVLELCRPGELPRFVVAEGIYGTLAAFEDRCTILKKGTWMTGARGHPVRATYPYAELSGIRFLAKTFTGTLELVPALEDYAEWARDARGDVQKRHDAIQLSKDVYEQAHDHMRWLRQQIVAARRAAHPDIELVDELRRLADLELIDALGEGEFDELGRVLLDRIQELGVPSARAAVTTALQRIHGAALEHPAALGLDDPEPFIAAIAEARAALGDPTA